jgi:tRNA(fMet)-specific endonuclease VapC
MLHLDTNIIVAHLRSDPIITRRLEEALPAVQVSTLVVGELIYGALVSSDPVRARARLDELLSSISVLPLDTGAAETFGRIRAALRRKGTPIGDVDTFIAVAMSRGATLVTRNWRHFSQVEGLSTDAWLEAPVE